MTGRMHFSARANWMMFTKEERRNIAIYILGISMFLQNLLCSLGLVGVGKGMGGRGEELTICALRIFFFF